MALYAISDLHLSESVPKSMDVFGGAWSNYRDKILSNLTKLNLCHDDTLVIGGDFSWGINLCEALADFKLIDSFPCKKLLIKGNHDLWWETVGKMSRFFAENNIKTLDFIHNNCYIYSDTAICGTRGWFFEEERGTDHDRKMLNRELMRLEQSLSHACESDISQIYCFLHYPPIYGSYKCVEMIRLMQKYHVAKCFYGHLHGKSHLLAKQGLIDGIEYRLISADFIAFKPLLIG